MNNLRLKEIVIIYGAIIFMAIIFQSVPSYYYLHGIDNISVSSKEILDDESRNLTNRIRGYDEPIINKYSTTISKDSLNALSDKHFSLVITRLWAEGYAVEWNGHDIGFSGDVIDGRANIWNSTMIFHIPDEFIDQENVLSITIHSKYDIGMFHHSIQVAREKDAMTIYGRYQNFSELLTILSVGISIFAIIISLVMIILIKHGKRSVLYMATIILFLTVYAFDFMRINSLPMPYLLFKKYVMESVFIIPMIFGLYITSLTKNKLPLFASVLVFAIFSAGTLISSDMVMFKKFYISSLTLIPICAIIYLFALYPKLKTSNEAKIFFGGVVAFSVVVTWETVTSLFSPSLIATSPLPLILVAVTMLTLLIANATIFQNQKLDSEINQKNMLFERTITDEVSGLSSRQHFINMVERLSPPYSIIMLDIDHFKKANDTFGHAFGDTIIKELAFIMKDSIRQHDFVGRYGGDEFIICLNTSPNKAYDICKRICANVRNKKFATTNGQVNVTVSIGIYHVTENVSTTHMFECADIALYNAKGSGRDCIKNYEQ